MAVWLVRAGSNGEQQEACLENSCVTIGWNDLPDLSTINDREEFKSIYKEHYPNEKVGAVNNRVGQIWSFAKKIEVNDLVVLPIKGEPIIAIGKVTASYKYTDSLDPDLRHIIPVKWINKELPRTRFDQDLLYSFGAFMTVCRIHRNNAEERVVSILEGRSADKIAIAEDIEDANIFSDIPQLAKDQIVQRLSEKFKGHRLEDLVEAILNAQGYVTDKTGAGPDGGADILAGSGPMGFDSPRILVEVKSGDTLIGGDVVDRMRGALDKFNADYGLCIAFNGFKSGVKKSNRNAFFKIRLWDQEDLLKALFSVYEKLPDDIQAELPLKRAWTLVEAV